MMFESIRCSSLVIPFKASFKHASAERATTQTFWVEASAPNGTKGYGEGCPREYVTGENLVSAKNFLLSVQADILGRIRDIPSLIAWVETHQAIIDANPSAWAAMEMALIDLFGKLEEKSAEAILNLAPIEGRFFYTAVLGDDAPREFEIHLARYLKAGFEKFKLKLSGDPARDLAKIRALKAAGIPAHAVRADANNLWPDAEVAIHDLAALDFSFFALEEPLHTGDYQGMHRIASAIGTRIILDESFLRIDQLTLLGAHPERWIINLRISKMGGIVRSLKLAQAIRKADLRIILGAHVGESSLLTRAALTVANDTRDILLAQEGAFGPHLLEKDITPSPITFGNAGVLEASALVTRRAGFGIEISPSILQDCTVNIV